MPNEIIAEQSVDGAAVDFIRKDVADLFPQYDLIRDCINGSVAVKAAGTKYLPKPNPDDRSEENRLRYIDYLTRAVFYGVTPRTLTGLAGQVFNVDPNITVPPILNAVVKDANGSGVPLKQLANAVETDVIAYGRAGLFIDFPDRPGQATTIAEQQSGEIRPNIINYKPWNIINWRTEKRGAKVELILVVLQETYEEFIGEFGLEVKKQYRVLDLVDGYYRQRLYRADTSGNFAVFDNEKYPTDYRGQRLNYIPFTFVGAINNDVSVDNPPLFDLADLNIAHYRNSADYEDSTYMVGQPTPVASGLTKDWVDSVLKGNIRLGSRAVIPLPEGGSFDIVQTQPNSQSFEAMQAKERQMVALGAKLVEQTTVQRTATEAGLETESETSILATITNNVSAAFKFALECCAIFAGAVTISEDADNESIVFELNTEFSLANASPDELRSTIEAWQKDAITFSEMRGKLRRVGYATLDDKKAQAEIDEAKQKQLAFTVEQNDALGFNNNNGNENA